MDDALGQTVLSDDDPETRERIGICMNQSRGQTMKKETNQLLLIISALLGVAALVLIVISIVGEFKTNWVLTAGLGCIALGSLLNVISLRKNKK